VVRPGHGTPGSSEVTSGHLNAHDALAWIRGIGKDHGLDAKASVHPAHGVPVDLAEQLGLEGTQAAQDAAAKWEQAQLEDQAAAAASSHQEAAGSDA
jgi:hypothetical protein